VTVPARAPGTSSTVHLTHLARLTTFTVWSWILIGVYFTLTLYITHCEATAHTHTHTHTHTPSDPVPPWLLRLTWVLYEVSFSVSLLITVVVTFVLIPGAKQRGLPVVNFFNTPALLMHNANVMFMLFEGANNRLPVLLPHIVFGVLYGILYTVFAWVWHWHKGIFYYFFLDYARKDAVLCHLALIAALGVFFYVGVLVSWLTEQDSPHTLLVSAQLLFSTCSLYGSLVHYV
jgi:hypothetical protein